MARNPDAFLTSVYTCNHCKANLKQTEQSGSSFAPRLIVSLLIVGGFIGLILAYAQSTFKNMTDEFIGVGVLLLAVFFLIWMGLTYYFLWRYAIVFEACAAPETYDSSRKYEEKKALAGKQGIEFILCPNCQEKNNPGFDHCWKCGSRFVN